MLASCITKTLTAGLLSLTLALTSVAPTTAAADISDEEAIAGIVALLLLGAAIHNNRDDDHRPPQYTQPGWQHRALPAQCVRRVTGMAGGVVRILPQRCLNNSHYNINQLPNRCRLTVRTANNVRLQGWGFRCLNEAGFRINQH